MNKVYNTDKMLKLLSKIDGIKSVKKYSPGGAYDTRNLTIKIDKGEDLSLCGFKESGNPMLDSEWDDCNSIDFLELSAHMDSHGGVEGCKKANTFTVYGKIKVALEKLGYVVVPTYKDYW